MRFMRSRAEEAETLVPAAPALPRAKIRIQFFRALVAVRGILLKTFAHDVAQRARNKFLSTSANGTARCCVRFSKLAIALSA